MADLRAETQRTLSALIAAPEAEIAQHLNTGIAENAEVHVSAPVETLVGREAIFEGLFDPLRRALGDATRRDLLLIGGTNRRESGGEWVASVTHITGIFAAPLWGIPPSGKLVFLRLGEFWRIEDGQIVEGRVIVDLLDLLYQVGRWPLPEPHYGSPITFPPPATQDGLCPVDRGAGGRSLDLVEAMLTGLHVYDPETYGSDGQIGADGTWSQDFAWYGPGGIGSTIGWDGFVDHHRAQFLHAFPDRRGGNHYCRIGDGAYAAVSGWPSMTMTHQGPYLGVPATGKALTLRVMDFYRCTDRLIAENWVLLDYVHLLNQMGVDPLADARRDL